MINKTSLRSVKIPIIKRTEILKVNNDNSIDCFYGIDNEGDKIDAMKIIQKAMSDYSSFKINYDFKVFTKFQKREWYFIGNIMIYENKAVRDETGILVDGKSNYECIFWMCAQK